MIKFFRLANMKSFSKLQEIRLSPITLIYGPNSSGKSSIIQSLLLLKQTILQGNQEDQLLIKGKLASLGNFQNIVHKHDISREITFEIGFNANHDAESYFHSKSRKLPFANSNLRKASFTYKCNVPKSEPIATLQKFEYQMPDKKFNLSLNKVALEGAKYKMTEYTKELIAHLSRESQIEGGEVDLANIFSLSDTANIPLKMSGKHSEKINAALAFFLEDLKDLFESIKYMGPLRSAPRRFYSSDESLELVRKGKRNLGIELYQAKQETVSKINACFREFDIPYEIQIKNIGNESIGEVISLTLRDTRTSALITPVDVGFGIGQIMPILLEALISKDNLICVEQPEIHLHPKLQANMADVFIESVQNGNQWIIETHSEALMLRIQKRIRSKKISKDLVSVVYIDVGEDGASVTNIPLDDNGDFTVHWPGGFFEERIEELYGDK